MQRFTNTEGRRLAELRRSNASGPHRGPSRQQDRRETAAELRAINSAELDIEYGTRDWLNP